MRARGNVQRQHVQCWYVQREYVQCWYVQRGYVQCWYVQRRYVQCRYADEWEHVGRPADLIGGCGQPDGRRAGSALYRLTLVVDHLPVQTKVVARVLPNRL